MASARRAAVLMRRLTRRRSFVLLGNRGERREGGVVVGMEVKAESRGLRVKGRRVAKEECRGRIPKRADFRVAQENRNAENATFLSFSSILMISVIQK